MGRSSCSGWREIKGDHFRCLSTASVPLSCLRQLWPKGTLVMIPGITKSYYGCSSTLSIQRLSTVNCEKHCVKDKFFAHSSVCESDNVTKWIWTKITGKRTTALRQYQLICAMSHAVFQTVPREVEPWTALYSV